MTTMPIPQLNVQHLGQHLGGATASVRLPYGKNLGASHVDLEGELLDA
jgi:hypothetical protein